MARDKTRLKGKINRVVGIATGDRKQEARGEVQEQRGHEPTASEQEKALHDVKASHHDYGERDQS